MLLSHAKIINKGVFGTGATYTRWGKTSCPNVTGTELLYAGRAGGTFYTTPGGAANKLCLPEDPDYLLETARFSGQNIIHGAEYRFYGNLPNLWGYNVPCAVCYVSTRTSVLIIPAKTQCPLLWTREYYGYLTAERDSHYRSSFECVDRNPEAIPGSSSNVEGALFYYVGGNCNGLACPPYEDTRILSCTVCTK